MVDLDTLPGGRYRLVLENKVNPSVESVKVALVSKSKSLGNQSIGMGGSRSLPWKVAASLTLHILSLYVAHLAA